MAFLTEAHMPLSHDFGKDYWEQHWSDGRAGSRSANPPNPHLVNALADLPPGTVLDAGCGAGVEAIWLAQVGWRVTAADISAQALATAAERAAASGVPDRIQWLEVDLSSWQPDCYYDLVTTHYAHPAMPQLEFYARIATWVAPGGTLLIVGHHARPPAEGHEHHHAHADHGEEPPPEVTLDSAAIAKLLDGESWEVVQADEPVRTLPGAAGREITLHDVVVCATRRRQ